MAKGAYSVVAYPTSCKLDEVLDRFRGSGASIMWILHDKDTDENGKPIDSHWHVAVGWEKGFPDWKTFLAMRDTINEECFTGDREKFNPSCFGKMTPEKCIVHDAELLQDYFLHRDEKSKAAGKHEYSEDELHIDETWLGSVYNSVEFRRTKASKKRKEETAAGLVEIFTIIREHDFKDWFELIDYVCSQCPEKMEIINSGAYCVKSYLDSVRCSHVYQSKLEKRCDELARENAELRKDNRLLHDTLEEYRVMYAEMISQTGDSVSIHDLP